MFHSDEFEVDDLFKHHDHWEQWNVSRRNVVMDIVIGLACVVGVAIILALLCRCCRSTKYRGRVLQPAPDPNISAQGAPYPQQQYSTVTVAAIPPNHGIAVGPPYPGGGAPYPTAVAPYPAGPYPGAAPYPAAGAPYPAAGAPYPAVSPYPAAHTSVAPSAPDAHALPPSYDQVMSTEPKHPPYNPYAPH